MIPFALNNDRPCRLRLSSGGHHRFGGPSIHQGAIPAGTNTALHLLVCLDLSDENCPVMAKGRARYLPLYYPLKYGSGGPELQYAVLSDGEIKLIYLSDESPDDVDDQYVCVSALPSSPAELIPLSYEEARAIEFAGGYFQPNDADRALLAGLNTPHPMIRIGGFRSLPRNAGAVICRNRECRLFGREIYLQLIASIPPVPVGGTDDFWHEYQGGDVEFCFGLCPSCGTIIGFNVAGRRCRPKRFDGAYKGGDFAGARCSTYSRPGS
jgi:hypothetical protein